MGCPGCGSILGRNSVLLRKVEGVGPIVWWHLTCGHLWPRFPEGHQLHHEAVRAIQRWADQRRQDQ